MKGWPYTPVVALTPEQQNIGYRNLFIAVFVSISLSLFAIECHGREWVRKREKGKTETDIFNTEAAGHCINILVSILHLTDATAEHTQ